MKHTLLSLLLCIAITPSVKSQTFYVNSGANPNMPANYTYKLNAIICDTLETDSLSNVTIHTCPATDQPGTTIDSTYTDIAIDKHENIWYVTTNGFLYKRKINDTSTCQYIGDFTSQYSGTNGLVADDNDNIYAAANANDTCKIYKYNPISGFSYIGHLPKDVYCNGDIFFFERRLFMTATDPDIDSTFLYEINLNAPEQSCYYMPLNNMQSWGAFAIKNGISTRVLVSTTDLSSYTSNLVEIDIPNKKILDTFCRYPFLIRGGGAYYSTLGDTSHCPYTPNGITSYNNPTKYLTILNPANNIIRIESNINQTEISSINLYDIYGKRVKAYSPQDYPKQLEISEFPTGLYILEIKTTKGEIHLNKLLKSN